MLLVVAALPTLAKSESRVRTTILTQTMLPWPTVYLENSLQVSVIPSWIPSLLLKTSPIQLEYLRILVMNTWRSFLGKRA